jgi:deoxyhypusine synthase
MMNAIRLDMIEAPERIDWTSGLVAGNLESFRLNSIFSTPCDPGHRRKADAAGQPPSLHPDDRAAGTGRVGPGIRTSRPGFNIILRALGPRPVNVTEFIQKHYRHFNAAALAEAADAYVAHLDQGGRMLVALGGAMSTAELGISLAEMVRREKVHAICCTGANLEEDVFNLVAHDYYRRIPDWRNLTPEQEKELESRGLNRVTDTCIPEDKAFRAIERHVFELWKEAEERQEHRLPHEFIYRLVRDRLGTADFQIDPAHSWVLAAAERDLPLFVPGWEDSTLGNIFVAHVLTGELSGTRLVRGGLDYMAELAGWYVRTTTGRSLAEPAPEGQTGAGLEPAVTPIGFFQIGGGIAGDFPICVVPMIRQDLGRECPYWGYFCQISDSTTSYGSYSGAAPTEKITWGKLDVETPKFIIESDATIVAPLIFARVLGW